MATIKATYKQFNGQDWDIVQFRTSASLVGERAVSYNDDGSLKASSLYFLRPETHTVNGKTFFNGTTHQGITLYASDIKLNGMPEAKTIYEVLTDMPNATVYFTDEYGLPTIKSEDGSYIYFTHDYDSNNLTIGAMDTPLYLRGVEARPKYIVGDTSHDNAVDLALYSDVKPLLDLLGEDSDNVINKIQDVFDVFAGMDDTTTIISLLNGKADLSGASFTGHVAIDSAYGIKTDNYYSKSGQHLMSWNGSNFQLEKTLYLTDTQDYFIDHEYGAASFSEVDIDTSLTFGKGAYIQCTANDGSNFEIVLPSKEGTIALNEDVTQVFTGTTDPTTITTNNVKAGDIWIEG